MNHRASTWQEIREFAPPPSGVPLQVRCEFARPVGPASIVLPLMFNGSRWRHINRSPEERGAWLDEGGYPRGVMLRPTHWQHFADPDMPAPVYRVIARRYAKGRVVVDVLADSLAYAGAAELAAHSRAFFAGLWSRDVYSIGCAPAYREVIVERVTDPELAGEFDALLGRWLADRESAADMLDRVAAESIADPEPGEGEPHVSWPGCHCLSCMPLPDVASGAIARAFP